MENRFIPSNEELRETDWKNPEVDSKQPLSIVSFLCIIGMIAVVFIPWFAAGIKADGNKLILQSFGFSNWYGIAGIVAAVIAALGILYKHYSLTLCSTVAAVVIGLIGLTSTPQATFKVKFADRETKEYVNEMLDMYDLKIKDITKIKMPSIVTEIFDQAFDFADQRSITRILKKTGFDEEFADELDADDFKVIHNRLGALLFLCLSFIAGICAYILTTGCKLCTCREAKETELE